MSWLAALPLLAISAGGLLFLLILRLAVRHRRRRAAERGGSE